jgi:glyoxylase-like metal-dependent hydrolase (beta-lactamase superfamily II)/rhodanese-related sulfurtransferase
VRGVKRSELTDTTDRSSLEELTNWAQWADRTLVFQPLTPERRNGEMMSKQIDASTLQGWLEARAPVTVVDIRTDDDYAQWAIPGSLHVNAYEALRNGQSGALAYLALPPDRPVVTVCNAGQVSQTAADVLSARGFDARSLAGGMKAWSVAWNTADVHVADPSVQLIQIRRTGKGCLSYIIGSEGEAAVIDPSVAPDVYFAIARRHGWSIQHAIDTHIHADHLSRAGELARLAKAALRVPSQHRARFPFTPIVEGESIRLGRATLRALATPGHTQESMSYVLNDVAVFTGDTLFTNGVGRPDLHADPDAARHRARALFASLARLRQLPSDLLILPAHTSEPIAFDGRAVVARLDDVATWLSGWMVSESAFVERLTSNLPPTPPNFVRIVELNEAGEFPTGDPTDLEAGANRCAVR